MRSHNIIALVSFMFQAAFASQTLHQTQPITIKATSEFKLDLQQIVIEPKTGSPTVSVGSPAMSVSSGISTESPLDSGRLAAKSEEITNPLTKGTASATLSAPASNQIPVTNSLSQNIAAVTLMLAKATSEETMARAEAVAKTARAQVESDSTVLATGNNHMNFGNPEFDLSVMAVEPEIAPELHRGMIGYNTAKQYAKTEGIDPERTQGLGHMSCSTAEQSLRIESKSAGMSEAWRTLLSHRLRRGHCGLSRNAKSPESPEYLR